MRRSIAAILFVMLLAVRAPATDYWVDITDGQDGTGGHDGSSKSLAWQTMEYADANIPTGGPHTLYAVAGTYSEGSGELDLGSTQNGRTLTIQSETGTPADVTITSTSIYRVIWLRPTTASTLTLKDLTLSGATTDINKGLIYVSDDEASLSLDHVVLTNTGDKGPGIYLLTGGGGETRELSVTNGTAITTVGMGIQVAGAGDITITDSTITTSESTPNGASACYLTGTVGDVTVTDSILDVTGATAAHGLALLADADSLTISGDTTEIGSTAYGVSIAGTVPDVSISEVSSISGTSTAINCANTSDIDSLTISGNTFGTSDNAVIVDGVIDAITVSGNTAASLSGDFFALATSSTLDSNRLRVLNNTISNCNRGIAIAWTFGMDIGYIEVTGNVVTTPNTAGAKCFMVGGEAVTNSNIGQIVCKDNTFTVGGSSGGHCVFIGPNISNAQFTHNLVFGGNYTCVFKGDDAFIANSVFQGVNAFYIAGGSRNRVSHCTFIGTSTPAAMLIGDNGDYANPNNNLLRDNIVISTTSGGACVSSWEVGGDNDVDTWGIRLDHNLYYIANGAVIIKSGQFGAGGDVTDVANLPAIWQAFYPDQWGYSNDANSLESTATILANRLGTSWWDFRPKAGSAAINAASDGTDIGAVQRKQYTPRRSMWPGS